MPMKSFPKNGIVGRAIYLILGALFMFALTSATVVPEIKSDVRLNTENITRHEEVLGQMQEQFKTLATKDDLTQMKKDLKELIQVMIKENGGE